MSTAGESVTVPMCSVALETGSALLENHLTLNIPKPQNIPSFFLSMNPAWQFMQRKKMQIMK